MPRLPPNIELHVVGDLEDVNKALRDHGIHPTDVLATKEKFDFCEVLVKLECEPGVERWFQEDVPITSPGCLVMYTL